MSNSEGVKIPIKATVDAKELGVLEGSINALKAQLRQAKADFDSAAPGSAAWKESAQRFADLSTRIMAGVKPLRDIAQAQLAADATARQLNAAMTPGINPWTTASAKYRDAQAALQAQTVAARDAAQASAALARAKAAEAHTSRGDAVASAQRQMAQDMRDAEASTLRLRRAADKLPEANDEVAKSSGRSARGVLELSRAFEDAQYGIAGVLNNLPNIITMFGGGAGLAGVLSMAAVSATVLYRTLSKGDFTGTWMGDVKDAVMELVDGMGEAEKEAREIMAAPDSWRKTGVEAATEYQTAVEKALTREIELLRQRNELLKAADEMRMKELQHAEKLARINNPNRASKGTDKWAENEREIIDSKYREGQAGRVNRMDGAYRDGVTAEEEKRIANAELAKAERTKAGLIKREELARQEATLKVSQKEDEAMLGHYLESESQGGYLTPEAKAEKEAIEKRIAHRKELSKSKRTLAGVQAEMETLPVPLPGEDMPAAHARAAADVLAKQDAATKAADAAAKASQNRTKTAKEVRMEEAEAAGQRNQDLRVVGETVTRTQYDDAVKERDENRKAAAEKKKKEEAEAKAFAEANEGKSGPSQPKWEADINEANKGLRREAAEGLDGDQNKTTGGEAKDRPIEYRESLRALGAALNDGKGDTAGETAIVKDLLAKLGTDRAQNTAALQQAVREMEAIQTDGSAMQQRLAGAMSAISSAFRAMSADLESVKSEFHSYRDANRR